MLFGTPETLHLLWLVPLLAAIGLAGVWTRRRRLARWADSALWLRLAPARSGVLRGFRLSLALLALGFAVVAAARPQVGARLVQVERQGIDVLAVLDVSLSMEATDVLPNRLERSKQEIRELFDRLPGDRVGIELFAGSAFLLCPLTLDVAAANLFLDAVEVDVLPDPGTNLEEALRGALRSLDTDEGQGARVVVLFTDGEGHVGDPRSAAQALRDAGIRVLTVGVGTPNGEPIPVLDPSGRRAGYKKDRAGNVVLSRLDERLLREIASLTGGEYLPATLEGREVGEIHEYIQKLERGELRGSVRRRVEERFQVPGAVAAVLLVLALVVPEAKRRDTAEGGEGGPARG